MADESLGRNEVEELLRSMEAGDKKKPAATKSVEPACRCRHSRIESRCPALSQDRPASTRRCVRLQTARARR